MKALFVLSIVVPVGFLTTLRVAGVLKGPVNVSETVTLETIKWAFPRPNKTMVLDDTRGSSFASNGLSTLMRVLIGSYIEDDPAVGSDYVTIGITMSSNSSIAKRFVESAEITFYEEYRQSSVDWVQTGFYYTNLSVVRMADAVTARRDFTKAFVEFAGTNQTADIYSFTTALWELHSINTQSHLLQIRCGITYFNGTVNKEIIQPFQLSILGS